MANIDKAFTVEHGISVNDVLGIFQSSNDPMVVGEPAPIGSILLRTNGQIYQKIGSGDTEWFFLVQSLQNLVFKDALPNSTTNIWSSSKIQSIVDAAVVTAANNTTTAIQESLNQQTQSVFGSNYLFEQNSSTISTTARNWVNALTLTTNNLISGTYQITWCASANSSNWGAPHAIGLIRNDNTVVFESEYINNVQNNPNKWNQYDGIVTLQLSGVNTFTLVFKDTGWATVSLKNKKIQLWRLT